MARVLPSCLEVVAYLAHNTRCTSVMGMTISYVMRHCVKALACDAIASTTAINPPLFVALTEICSHHNTCHMSPAACNGLLMVPSVPSPHHLSLQHTENLACSMFDPSTHSSHRASVHPHSPRCVQMHECDTMTTTVFVHSHVWTSAV